MTTAATPSGMMRLRLGVLVRLSTVPLASTTFLIAVGSARTPLAAIVAYAAAMSSGDTAIEPRPRAGTYAPRTSSGVRTPSRVAIAATRLGVTSSVSWA